MSFEFFAIIALAGLTITAMRIIGERLRVRRVHGPLKPQRITCDVGTLDGESFSPWIHEGYRLPRSEKRMFRVSSSGPEALAVELHTRGFDDALLGIEINGLREGPKPVRLVELSLQIEADGRVLLKAAEKSTGRRLDLRFTHRRSDPLRVTTEDDPRSPEEVAEHEGRDLGALTI